MATFKSVDEYIKTFPADIQKRLEQIRKTIKDTTPESDEVISYNMPAFKLNGKNLIYYSTYKNHISIYPFPSGVQEFERITNEYSKSGKGTIQFPHNEPLPLELVKKVVEFRVNELKNK